MKTIKQLLSSLFNNEQTTKDCNIMTLDIDKTFIDFLSQEIVRIIDKKIAELDELKKHITL